MNLSDDTTKHDNSNQDITVRNDDKLLLLTTAERMEYLKNYHVSKKESFQKIIAKFLKKLLH
ncbi:MAG: hypothetical protein ISR69_14030 [Gammaproteobacteria bacterium]|nr:hypothetical protein [Gammaproteobacteria bacterium]